MTDEEASALAAEVLMHAWRQHQKYVDLTNINAVKNDRGHIEFRIVAGNEDRAYASVEYCPQPWIEGLLKANSDYIDSLAKKGVSKKEISEKELGFHRELDEVVSILVRNLNREFEYITQAQAILAERIFFRAVGKEAESFLPTKISASDLKRLEDWRKEAHKFVETEIDHVDIGPHVLFALVYDSQRTLWKKAKECYETNKRSSNVLEIVRSSFPDLQETLLPDLSSLDSYESTIESLALRSSALILGVRRRNKINPSIRTLQKYLQESRELAESLSPSEIESRIADFIEFRAIRTADLLYLESMDAGESEVVSR